MILNVLSLLPYEDATASDARAWEDGNGLSFPVLADTDGSWVRDWGAMGGISQHSYTVVDSEGKVSWRKDDGNSTSLDALRSAVLAAD
jgi:hypothetical protein